MSDQEIANSNEHSMRPPMGRRAFFTLSAGLAVSLRADDRPELKFPVRARERLAVSTYPFRSLVISPAGREGNGAKPSLTLQQFAATVREKLNVTGLEPWSHHFESTSLDYIHELNRAFREAGLHVVNIPVDIEVHLCGSAQDRKAGLAAYYKWVDAAVILGSPSIRVHLPHGESGGQISCAVSALGELARYGAAKNIVINVENAEPELEQPERVAKVIQAVNSPFFHALPDFCNSMLVPDDAQYNYQAMRLLFPLAFNISHVKDAESGDNGKVYHVDVAQIFKIAKQAGYRGYFSVELEAEGDPYEGTRKLLAASLTNLSH